MLGLEDFMTIQALVKRGVYLCDIAEQLGVHPRTVRRALHRGGPPAPRRGRQGSRLDPYRAQVDQLLSEGVWNAVPESTIGIVQPGRAGSRSCGTTCSPSGRGARAG